MTNENGDILYISGRTGKYIEAAAGKANWNIFVMAREGIRYGLTTAFQKAVREKETVTLKNLVVDTNTGKQVVNVTIQPLTGDNRLDGMVMVVFTDIVTKPPTKPNGKPHKDTERVTQLEQELESARQEVQSTREEMQTSQEELKSTNEELQSTNEELQSTNEELTTSKEELQSMNEELHTVNQELQTRLDELAHTNNDMKNLLDSTDIATLVEELLKIEGDHTLNIYHLEANWLIKYRDRLIPCFQTGKIDAVFSPIQSGSNRILKAMRRPYTREAYVECIKALRKEVPALKIWNQFIVGFPGETDEDHADSMKVLDQVNFNVVQAFEYSDRPGTAASKMENKTPPDVMKQRLKQIRRKILLKVNLKKLKPIGRASGSPAFRFVMRPARSGITCAICPAVGWAPPPASPPSGPGRSSTRSSGGTRRRTPAT